MGEYHHVVSQGNDGGIARTQIAAMFNRDKDDVMAYVTIALVKQPDGGGCIAWSTNLPDEAAAGFMLTAIENHALALVYQAIADEVPDDLSSLDNI